MVKDDIETVIDRLLVYVQTNKEVELSAASRAMALPPAQIEKLALLLEESGLLTVKYALTSTKIVSKEFSETQAEKAKQKIAVRKDEIILESEEAEREVLTAESLLSFIERDVARRLEVAEKLLVSLESRTDYSREDYDFIEKELTLILQQAAMFEDEVRKLNAREAELRETVIQLQKRLEAISGKIPSAQTKKTGAAAAAASIAGSPAALLAKIKLFFSLAWLRGISPSKSAQGSAAETAAVLQKAQAQAQAKARAAAPGKPQAEPRRELLKQVAIVPAPPKKTAAGVPSPGRVSPSGKASVDSAFDRIKKSVNARSETVKRKLKGKSK